MPNTAIAIQESMTCLCTDDSNVEALPLVKKIFDALGRTLVIDETLMVPATALCACGIAFFLRAVRAASQGGIEIGFHAEEALLMAAQTARGAASLLVKEGSHPESEVDKVTTPQGCTISGLNQMEHHGFSSALIKGITTSAAKAAVLYSPRSQEK
jgi:pyrroline-5-carboxylate reductase